MQYKIFFVNCGKCRICRADKSIKPHGPYLKLRVSRSHGRKDEDYIGRWRHKNPLPAKQCPAPGCSKEFVPKVAWKEFCSDACRVRAHYHANKLKNAHMANETQKMKASKQTVKKKQDESIQSPAEPTPPAQPAPVEVPAPAPTLAAALLAVVAEWQRTHGLAEQEFFAALEETWQAWQPS